MADLQFIRENRDPDFRFEVAPLHNVLCSLCLLDQKHLDGISEWVDATVATMTPEERERSGQACEAVVFAPHTNAQTIDEFLDALRATKPGELFRLHMHKALHKASLHFRPDELPSADELSASEDAFVNLIRRVYEANEEEFNEGKARGEYQRFARPGYASETADLIEELWSKYLRDEWEKVRPAIEDSVKAFRSIDVPGQGIEEKLKFVTQRDFIPSEWLAPLRNAAEIVFVPSVHIGPYMLLFDHNDERAIIVGRARIPEGANVSSASLSRSDLLIRLDALSDSVRLAILELAAQRGLITTQDVIDELSLSQSSASRHLTQLAATGLMAVDASERTKKYSVHTKRIADVCESIQHLLTEQAVTR